MKTVLRLSSALLALCLAAAAHALTTITPATHEVGAGTVPYQILVTSDEDWAASTTANWVTLSRTVGSLEGSILVTAAANTTGADRSATIVVNGVTHILTQRSAGIAIQEVWAFGDDREGQLGDNNAPQFQRSSPGLILANGVQSVAAGGDHTLIVRSDGSLWAMGNNDFGQLGDGTTTTRSTPVLILASGVQSVAAGVRHSLIVKTDGSLWAMGANDRGQLGDGTNDSRSTPVQILAGGVRSVAATGGKGGYSSGGLGSGFYSVWESGYRSLVVKTDGSLWTTGNDSLVSRRFPSSIPLVVRPVQILADGVQSVSVGVGYCLIVKTDGSLWKITDSDPIQILASGVQAISAGYKEPLIVKTDGSLWAMGEALVQVFADGVQSAVTVGSYFHTGYNSTDTYVAHALIVKTDGSVWAMGTNDHGELGDGTQAERPVPVQILAGGAQSVAVGLTHSLIVKTDGSLWGMGDNQSGKLGDGLRIDRSSPIQVLAGEIQSLAAGGAHSFVLKTDGSLWAMGRNDHGQLGDGTTADRASPALVSASGVQSVSAGFSHSLIVNTDGSLWAMGLNDRGQLGDGTTADRGRPTLIFASGVRSAVAGDYHSLIVKTDGSLWAMGSNEFGQLGDGTNADRPSPVQILVSGVESVAAGTNHSLIVKIDGSLWATGWNRWSPIPILASGVQSVSAGSLHSLIVKTDGSLWAMGSNEFGQLGDGTEVYRGNPVRILARGVRSAAAGARHSLIMKADGSLWAMGSNLYGELGDGTKGDRSVPVLVAHDVEAVAAGATHSLIIASGAIAPTGRVVRVQPVSTTVGEGYGANLTVEGFASPDIQWYRGGRAIANGTGGTLSLIGVTPADAGIYDAVLSVGTSRTLSWPAVVGVIPLGRTAGAVTTRDEWLDIHHPNGAIFDQFLLTGAAGTFTADPGQIARCSFLDENDSIVQVEMSGRGAITIVLDNATGPMAPALYSQPGIQYMKGKATIILAGSDETTHFTIYSVGPGNNLALTRPDATYNGWADVTAAGIVSTNGGLGGIHQGNVSFNAATGYTGIVAPNVNSVGELVVVHSITASDLAQSYLFFGPGYTTVKIAGSSLAQPNGEVISINGIGQAQMGAGQDSCGRAAPAQAIATRLFDDEENDVTTTLVTGP